MTANTQRARELLRGYVDDFRAAASLGRALTHVEIDELESTIEAVLAQSAQQDVSDSCAISGCHHKAFGCPTWPEGTNPFTQQAGAVPEGFVLVDSASLQAVHSALDRSIGDTDPYVAPDANDEEVHDELPVFWAAQQVAFMLDAAPAAPSGGWRS